MRGRRSSAVAHSRRRRVTEREHLHDARHPDFAPSAPAAAGATASARHCTRSPWPTLAGWRWGVGGRAVRRPRRVSGVRSCAHGRRHPRITALTGVTFGDGYERTLADGGTVMNLADAVTGLVALRRQDPARAVDTAWAIRHAWYFDGRSLPGAVVCRDVAEALGLDLDSVAAAYAASPTRAQVGADFRAVRRTGVDGCPTLLHGEQGIVRLGGPVSSVEALTRACKEQLATAAPERCTSCT